MIQITDIDTLIDHAESLIKSIHRNSNFGRTSKTPGHLTYDIRRIASHYETTGEIALKDIKYLEHIYNATDEYLLDHVYIHGKWTTWQSTKHRNYNIKRGTQPTKVSGFVNRR